MKIASRRKILRAMGGKLAAFIKVHVPEALATPDARRDTEAQFEEAMKLWDARLKVAPEPTHEKLEKFFKEWEQVDLPAILRAYALATMRKFRPSPPGKKPKLTATQQRKALAKVRRRIAKGNSPHKAAYKEIARMYSVHWRTIQNLYLKASKKIQKGDA